MRRARIVLALIAVILVLSAVCCTLTMIVTPDPGHSRVWVTEVWDVAKATETQHHIKSILNGVP